jgi:hypothetical protein
MRPHYGIIPPVNFIKEGSNPLSSFSSLLLVELITDRLKDVAQAKYSQNEADFGAGLSKEILPPVRSVAIVDEEL